MTQQATSEQVAQAIEEIDTTQRYAYTVREVATIFAIDEHTIYDQVGKGVFPIPAIKFGRAIRFSKPLVEQYLGKALFGVELKTSELQAS